MQVMSLLEPLLASEKITRGLGDAEARILVDWLAERAEELVCSVEEEQAVVAMAKLYRKARSIVQFVRLWCKDKEYGAAQQFAALEKFTWPWPTAKIAPWKLMAKILEWEMARLDETPDWALES